MFVKSIFTGNWKKAWQGVKKIFKGVWDTLYSVVKAPINLIIGAVNKMTSAIESAVNWIIDGINSLSFDVPDWVPGIGGETFGFDLDTISIPEIPKSLPQVDLRQHRPLQWWAITGMQRLILR